MLNTTDSTNATQFNSILQEWCERSENTPHDEQRIDIYTEFGLLSLAFFLAFVYVVRTIWHDKQDPLTPGLFHILFRMAPLDFEKAESIPLSRKLFLRFAAVGTATGVASWLLNMQALVDNDEFLSLVTNNNQTAAAAASLSRALKFSAAFDSVYAIEFFCLTYAKFMAFRYALQQKMTVSKNYIFSNFYNDLSTICLSLTDRLNFCGIIFRGLAAWQAVDASNDVSLSSIPQFTAAFDLSRKFASYQLICECTSLFIIVVYICFHLYKEALEVCPSSCGDAPSPTKKKNSDGDSATQPLKQKSQLEKDTEKEIARWSKYAVIVVAITFFIRFVFTVLYTAASVTPITYDCKDPCGSCQSALALIWSLNVLAPYVRVAVVFISGPLVVFWVLFCMNKVQNAEKNLAAAPTN